MARILWVSVEVPDRNGQGGQRRQYHQINALRSRGHAITVLVPASKQNGRTIDQLVSVMRPRLSILGRLVRRYVVGVRRIIASDEWDAIIVSHHESWWLLPPRSEISAPTLLDVHNVNSYWHRRAGRDELARTSLEHEARAVRAATVVTTCSETEQRRLVQMHPEAAAKTFAAPLGVDPLEWPDVSFDRTDAIVAMFGSWAWRPNSLGLDWFMAEVWTRVRTRLPEAVALVAGSGVDDTAVWPEGARFVGRVPDLASFAAAATVVAVPVLDGVGASVKFAEALASGAAVIATTDGANAFDEPPAFISENPDDWATWIVERLLRRNMEAVPALSRTIALRDLTWDAATEPIDQWLKTVVPEPTTSPPVSS